MINTVSKEQLNIVATNVLDYAISIRRELHKIPELGFEETKTINYLKKEIKNLIKESRWETSLEEKKGGLIVNLLVKKEYKKILFRADIDGLPIEEKTNLSFSSTHSGKMHACGHDMHAAMLLAGFKQIIKAKVIPKVNICFVWQRSEEKKVNGISGGKLLIEEGVLQNIDSVYALHVLPSLNSGVFCSKPGKFLANTNQYHISLSCLGGHVMRPSLGSNAMDILLEIQQALNGFTQRVLTTAEEAILVPSIIHAGKVSNVRPSSGKISFSFRHFLEKKRVEDFNRAFLHKIGCIIQSYHDAQIEKIDFLEGYPMLINEKESFFKIKQLLKENGLQILDSDRFYCGEDFSYYLQNKPGSFWWLGTKKN